MINENNKDVLSDSIEEDHMRVCVCVYVCIYTYMCVCVRKRVHEYVYMCVLNN